MVVRGSDMSDRSEVQVSYDLGAPNGDKAVATITRVFENGFKVLAILDGSDAEAFIEAWQSRRPHPHT